MIPNWWTPKNFVLAAAIVLFACVAGGVAIGLAYPEPVSSAALGPDWQCSRMAFVWTTCSRRRKRGCAPSGGGEAGVPAVADRPAQRWMPVRYVS